MSAGEAGKRALILVRTHFVDDRVAEMARRFASSGEYGVMIALDETAGEIDARGLPKLSMTLDSCVRLGLNVAYEQPLWRCGDYLFYHALALGYPRYWSIEYDIALNYAEPLDFFRFFDAEAPQDYLSTFLEVADPKWHWRRAASRRFSVVYTSGFALVRLSARAIAQLLERRRLEAASLSRDKLSPEAHWLNDEAFVSSAIPEMGLEMADLNKFGDFYSPKTLMRGGVWHPEQLPPHDNKIYHAVRTGPSFLRAAKGYYEFQLGDFLAYADPALPEFDDSATHLLARRLEKVADDPPAAFAALQDIEAHFTDPRIAAALMRALARNRLRLCIEAVQFGRIATPIARTPAHDNVALARPAWQSSTSRRSRAKLARRDAEGGNDGDCEAEYGFHTAFQDAPWWAVDLGDAHRLRMVRLYNRRGAEFRLRRFVIETSLDFLAWTTVFAHAPADEARLRARPIEIALEAPVAARYLRVRLPRKGVLHLAEVEVMKA